MISVLVPTYNQEKYISDCLESLLRQSFVECEIIISDDCSDDQTWRIIERYKEKLEEKFRKVVIHRNIHNVGIPGNLNWLISNAHGELIKFLSGDDFVVDDCICICNECFQRAKDVDIWVSNGIVVQDDASIDRTNEGILFYDTPPNFDKSELVKRLYIENYVFSPSMAVKRELFDKWGGYEESIAIDDWNQVLKWAVHGAAFGYIDKALTYYRKSDNSITSMKSDTLFVSRRKKIFESSKYILNEYKSYVDSNIWAKRMINLIINECEIAINHSEKEYLHDLINELKMFSGWRCLRKFEMIKFSLRFLWVVLRNR